MKLSVIVPFVGEYPQILFTLQSINQALRHGGFDYEVLAVNNWCKEVSEQVVDGKNRVEDKGAEAVKACAKSNRWLRYYHYQDKLSHWQAKNLGVQNSTGDYLWFVDGHCVAGDSIVGMLKFYEKHHDELNGTIHLPLTYKILEAHKLIYKLVWVPETHELHYTFSAFRHNNGTPYEVPCMSTCGMLMSREVYNRLGGWPKELGIYGGGENFINYALATMGMKKWIYPDEPLYHHGEKRGYNWNYDDSLRNRFIAYFCACGKEFAEKAMEGSKGRPQTKRNILDDVIAKCSKHREHIANQQKYTIYEWLEMWKQKDANNLRAD